MPCDLAAPAWCQWGFHWLPSRDYPQPRQLARCQGRCPDPELAWERQAEIQADFERRVVQRMSAIQGKERTDAIDAAAKHRLGR
jgi:hypothetical protein